MNQYNEYVYKGKNDPEIQRIIKELVCDYLIKNGYDETFEIFKKEANAEPDISKVEFSSLVELVTIFMRIIDTRCGKLKTGPDVHRIEAIMMKIIAEKQRCMQIISANKPVPQYDPRNMRQSDRMDYERIAMSSTTTPPARGFNDYQQNIFYTRQRPSQKGNAYHQESEIENGTFKIVKTLKIHQNKISCSALAPKSLVLFIGSLDFTISIINMKTYEYSIEQFHKSVRICRIKDFVTEVVVGVGFLDQELQIFKYIGNKRLQHINGIQTPGAIITAFEFSENNLYTVDADGKLVVWTISGKFVSMHHSSPKILDICYLNQNNLIINEPSKISVLDLSNNEVFKIISKTGASHIRKVEEELILVVQQDVISVYNQNYERIKCLDFQKNVKASGYISGNIILGYENCICLHGLINTSLRIHSMPICTLDVFCISEVPYIVTGSLDGELKICELMVRS